MPVLKHLKRMFTDWFLCGMLLATFLAYVFPHFGSTGGAMHAEWVINIGVFLVFFLHGVNLSSEQISHGLKNIRLHVMVQGFTFIVFPLIAASGMVQIAAQTDAVEIVANKVLGAHIPPLLMLGFFYLCALPSTISSSVALTGSAGGNVPAAILNASLSSVLGIFLTPLLVSFVVGSGAGGIDLGSTLLDLCAMLLLPLVLGQLVRPMCGRFFARHKRYTNICDKVVILYGQVLQAAIRHSMDRVNDVKTVDQILGLEVINNRVDHPKGGKDDCVVAWLLTHWFTSYGANLTYYGIDVTTVMSSTLGKKALSGE